MDRLPAHQSIARPLTAAEAALADALEAAWRDGATDPASVAAALAAAGVPSPDGTAGWTGAVLEAELARLDDAFETADG